MKKLMILTSAVACLFSLSFFFSSCQEEEGVTPTENLTLLGGNSPKVDVYSPKMRTFGKTYNEWTQAWWKYMLSIPYDRNPINDKSGALALVGQNGPVVFLAGSKEEHVDRNITLTSDKAILIPVVTVLNSFPCPYAAQPKPGQSLEDFLKAGAQAIVDQVTSLQVKIDGKDITRFSDYRVTTNVFTVSGSPDLSPCFGSCVTTDPKSAVGDGYFILLKGLNKGDHTIQYNGETAPAGSVPNVTYHIRVVR